MIYSMLTEAGLLFKILIEILKSTALPFLKSSERGLLNSRLVCASCLAFLALGKSVESRNPS